MINALFSSLPLWVCVFWFSTLFLNHKSNTLHKNYLILFFFIAIINYFAHFLYFNNQYYIYCFAESIWIFTSLSLFPFYYYYIRLLTKDSKIELSWLWLFIPAFILSLFSFILYFLMDDSEKNIFIYKILYHSYIDDNYSLILKLQLLKLSIFRIIFITQVLVFIIVGIKHISLYNKSIKEFYSETRNKEFRSIKYLLIVFIFASIVSSLSAIVGKSFFINNQALISIPSLVHSVFLYGVGFIGYKQYFSIIEFRNDILNADRKNDIKEFTQKNINNDNLKEQLILLLEEKEIFKNPDLRISDVSTFLNTNRTYISNLVNEEFNQSFADFINNYRIKYAKNILQDKKQINISISEIGYMSGFLSESSFYRVFKDKVGVSPGHYRKKFFETTKSINK